MHGPAADWTWAPRCPPSFASFWATAGFTAKKRLASPRMIAAVRRFMVPRQFPNLKQCTVLFENGQVHPDNVSDVERVIYLHTALQDQDVSREAVQVPSRYLCGVVAGDPGGTGPASRVAPGDNQQGELLRQMAEIAVASDLPGSSSANLRYLGTSARRTALLLSSFLLINLPAIQAGSAPERRQG